MTAIRRLSVRGRVQGVGYRVFVAEEAAARGVQGWVRNRRDGTVETVLAGSPDALGELMAALRRGPAGARVDAIEDQDGGAADLALRRAGEPFSILPTQ